MKKWLLSDFFLVIVIDGLYVTRNEQNWVLLHFSAVQG